PEQEARGWAVLDALDAAKASGDKCRILQASLDLIDWQLAVGLLTREKVRRLLAPHLLDGITRPDAKPECRPHLQKLRDDALEALNGDDYRERTAAALFIMCLDGVQNPRRREAWERRQAAARAGVAFVAENAAPCLESGHWALEDVEAQLVHALDLLEQADGGDE